MKTYTLSHLGKSKCQWTPFTYRELLWSPAHNYWATLVCVRESYCASWVCEMNLLVSPCFLETYVKHQVVQLSLVNTQPRIPLKTNTKHSMISLSIIIKHNFKHDKLTFTLSLPLELRPVVCFRQKLWWQSVFNQKQRQKHVNSKILPQKHHQNAELFASKKKHHHFQPWTHSIHWQRLTSARKFRNKPLRNHTWVNSLFLICRNTTNKVRFFGAYKSCVELWSTQSDPYLIMTWLSDRGTPHSVCALLSTHRLSNVKHHTGRLMQICVAR